MKMNNLHEKYKDFQFSMIIQWKILNVRYGTKSQGENCRNLKFCRNINFIKESTKAAEICINSQENTFDRVLLWQSDRNWN